MRQYTGRRLSKIDVAAGVRCNAYGRFTLGELIDSITVHHDAERGHTALLEDKLLELLRFGYIKKAASLSTAACSLKLVAGVGFEPTTFRL